MLTHTVITDTIFSFSETVTNSHDFFTHTDIIPPSTITLFSLFPSSPRSSVSLWLFRSEQSPHWDFREK